MRYLFVPGADLTRESITLDGPDAHHLLNVLRIREGEPLTLLDDSGGACRAEVTGLGKRTVTASILGAAPCPPDPPVRITVAQALGKGDKFEQVLQHATEIGASAFIPLLTERTVTKLDVRDAESKLARWSLIAKGAAEQAGRGRIPVVEPPATLRELCSRFAGFDYVMLLNPPEELTKAAASHTPTFPHCHTLLLVGPEGGFSPSEVEMASTAGAVRTSLGPFTLRTETAALVALSRILHEADRE